MNSIWQDLRNENSEFLSIQYCLHEPFTFFPMHASMYKARLWARINDLPRVNLPVFWPDSMLASLWRLRVECLRHRRLRLEVSIAVGSISAYRSCRMVRKVWSLPATGESPYHLYIPLLPANVFISEPDDGDEQETWGFRVQTTLRSPTWTEAKQTFVNKNDRLKDSVFSFSFDWSHVNHSEISFSPKLNFSITVVFSLELWFCNIGHMSLALFTCNSFCVWQRSNW